VAHQYFIFDTAGGSCGIAWSDIGISRFQLPAHDADATEKSLRRRLTGARQGAPTTLVTETIEAVKLYFEGHNVDFTAIELDLGGQSEFFGRIYAAARRIGWGQTTTYGGLARDIGAGPETARAVGQAMATNPIPLIIPCHRVLAAGGKVGGFSAPGGSASKIRMLELEGVPLAPAPPAPPAQQSLEF
jgi:methylated-DNA-[protein]-cysteine S-methyltransferase